MCPTGETGIDGGIAVSQTAGPWGGAGGFVRVLPRAASPHGSEALEAAGGPAGNHPARGPVLCPPTTLSDMRKERILLTVLTAALVPAAAAHADAPSANPPGMKRLSDERTLTRWAYPGNHAK